MKYLVSLIAVALLLVSCQPAPLTEDAGFKAIAAEGWAYGERFEFNPEYADSVGYTGIAVAIRHNNDYPYSNLWLELKSPVPGSDAMRIDTIDLEMADVYGHWYGRGAAMSYIIVDTLPGRYYYDRQRPMSLRHIMRVDTVPDLTQVGLLFFNPESIKKCAETNSTL